MKLTQDDGAILGIILTIARPLLAANESVRPKILSELRTLRGELDPDTGAAEAVDIAIDYLALPEDPPPKLALVLPFHPKSF